MIFVFRGCFGFGGQYKGTKVQNFMGFSEGCVDEWW